MPFAQPWEEAGVSSDPVLHVQTGRRQNDDVGVPDVVDRKLRREAERTEARYAASVDRGDPHPEARLLSVAVQIIPEHARGVKDFDRPDRRRRIAGFQKDDRYIQYAVTATRSRRLPGAEGGSTSRS